MSSIITVIVNKTIYSINRNDNNRLYETLATYHKMQTANIKLRVVGISGRIIEVVIPALTPILPYIEEYFCCKVRLVYEGHKITNDDTTLSLEMSDNDWVDCIYGWR